MALPTTDKCCCCINLRLGAILIGAFGLIASVGALLRPAESEGEKIDKYLEEHKGWLYFIMVVLIVAVISHVSLLIGAFLNNRPLVLVYVLGFLGVTVFNILLTIFLSIAAGEYAGIFAIIGFIIPLYFVWVGFSYHKDMEARLP